MRYMYLVYGIAPYDANGNTVVSNYSGTVLTRVNNNGTSLPSPGAIISEAGTKGVPAGHTGVVTKVSVSNGTGTVTMMEQNASAKGWVTIQVANNILGNRVTGWLSPIHRWQTAEAPLPQDASATNPGVGLNSVACPSASSCVAAGSYYDSSGHQQVLLETFNGSAWTGTKAPLPAGAATNPQLNVASVVCPSASSCVAIGNYSDSSGGQQGLLETFNGSAWTGTNASLPAGAATNPQVNVASVACPSVSSCVAVGNYSDSSGLQQGLLEIFNGSAWTGTQAPTPATGTWVNPQVSLLSIACPSQSACIAVGDYTDSSPTEQALLETLSGSIWTATQAPRPASAYTTVSLSAVTCYSAASCIATGAYFDTSEVQQWMAETLSGTTWTVRNPPLPANGLGGDMPWGLPTACPSALSCLAVGTYFGPNYYQRGLLETISGTTWKAAEAPLPANAGTNPDSELASVACPLTTYCVAVGNYDFNFGLLLTGPS